MLIINKLVVLVVMVLRLTGLFLFLFCQRFILFVSSILYYCLSDLSKLLNHIDNGREAKKQVIDMARYCELVITFQCLFCVSLR